MGKTEIGANEVQRSDKKQQETPVFEIEISYLDIDTNIVEGDIIKEDESKYSISLSYEENNNSSSKPEVDVSDGNSILDKIQFTLDVAGFVPAFGAVPDIINGLIYICRGDWGNAGLSFLAAIPVYGDSVAAITKGAKFAKTVKQTQKTHKVSERAKLFTGVKSFKGGTIDSYAKEIIKDAKGKRVSFLWTNGTKGEAIELAIAIRKNHSDVRVLEKIPLGRHMENTVNKRLIEIAKEQGINRAEIARSYRNETLWKDVFYNKKWARIQSLDLNKEQKVLERYQRLQSRQYAEMIKDDYIVEIRKYGNRQGQANMAELEKLFELGRDKVDGVIKIMEKTAKPGIKKNLSRVPIITRDTDYLINTKE